MVKIIFLKNSQTTATTKAQICGFSMETKNPSYLKKLLEK